MASQPNSAQAPAAGAETRVRRPRQAWHLEAYLFLLPSFLGLAAFVLLPIAGALVLSFAQWNLLSPPTFVGVANYAELLRDPLFFQAFWNTIYYTVFLVPLQLGCGLLIAVALHTVVRGAKIYRVIYFMPVVTSIVAAALIFQWMFNRDFGIISALFWEAGTLTGLPISPPDWLNSSAWAKPSIIMLALWKNVGFTVVIYLAGLQAVPQELYDAARVDGANAWQALRKITLPLISPTTFFLLVIQMTGAFQLFSEPFVMTRGEGGPAGASKTLVMYIYDNAFSFGRMGKAAAIAWVLFLLIFACTFVQNRFQSRWVHYESGEA